MKTVGIIGGMGPEATNQLVIKIIDNFEAMGKKTRPNILVSFVPVNLKNETKLITDNDFSNFPELLIESAKSLEKGGADFIIIACNSVHLFINVVRNSVSIPVLSVIEETEKFLTKNNIKKTAIIGSSFSIKNKLFEFRNIKIVKPSDIVQLKISSALDNLAKGVTNTNNEIEKQVKFWIDNNIEVCLLACSELQLLRLDRLKDKINLIDTMQILSDITVKNLLK